MGASQTIDLMRKVALEDQGHFETRALVEAICEGLDSKDYLSEYLACYHFLLQNTRYMRDPRRQELLRAPWVTSKAILDGHRPSLDCLPADTLLLKRGYELVPIRDIKVGDEIWGYDQWTRVEAVAYKGILPVDTVRMNNGSSFSATPDHKVFVDTCTRHPSCWDIRGHKSCGDCADRTRVRVKVADLEEGAVLARPFRLPFGDEEMEPDRALIEGFYISDGWCQDYSFSISGQDGCPKEEQKREVETICKKLGVETTWHRKSIMVRDSKWTATRIEHMGARAPEKHALSINLSEGPAASLLRGIMADSGKNTYGSGRTFTTTSYQLFLQTRLLHKMFAVSCGERFITNHGGLGKNPIWRLQTNFNKADGVPGKRLRVKDIERNVISLPVYDLQTSDHYVYLPHADVTVSNCDDMIQWLGAATLALGGTGSFVTAAFKNMFYIDPVTRERQRQYSHVFMTAQEPRSGTSIVLDPVAADKTSEMLRRIKAARTWPIAA